MEPLVTTERVLIRIHMCPADDDDKISNKWKTFSRISIVLFFIVALTAFLGTLAFFIEFVSIDLQRALLALIPVAGTFNLAYVILAAFFLRYKTKRIFTQLSAIYSASTCILVVRFRFFR